MRRRVGYSLFFAQLASPGTPPLVEAGIVLQMRSRAGDPVQFFLLPRRSKYPIFLVPKPHTLDGMWVQRP